MPDTTVLLGALDAVQRGWLVFPLLGKGRPVKGWQDAATLDQTQVCAWWQEGYQFGVKCGPSSNLIVVDDDRPQHGAAPWAPDEGLPPTLQTVGESGMGVRHHYEWPADRLPVPNSVSRLASHVDVRGCSGGTHQGDGSGYIVAPGSFGGRIVNDLPVAQPPHWLLAKARGRADALPADLPEPSAPPPDAAGRVRRVREYVDALGFDGTSDGDLCTFTLACYLARELPFLDRATLTAMLKHWHTSHTDEMSDEWYERKLDDAWLRAQPAGAKEIAEIIAAINIPIPEPPPAPARVQQAAPPAPVLKANWKSHREILKQVQGQGPRVPLGYEPLDKRLRGGAFPGWLVTIGGAPGAGKTMLLTQMGANMAKAGYQVRHLEIDEDSPSVLQRRLQQCGLSQDEAEAATSGAGLDRAIASLDGVDYICDDESEYLDEIDWCWAPEGSPRHKAQRIILIDSLQKVRTRETADSVRGRVDAVIAHLRLLGRRDGVIVVATSELTRTAYRSKADEDNINLLASGKESGAIEYASSAYLVIQRVEDEQDVMRHTLAKARRGGQTGSYYARLDYAGARFLGEVEHTEREAAVLEASVNREGAIEAAIRQAIVSEPTKISKANIHDRIRSRENGWTRDSVRAIFDVLVREGMIDARGKGSATKYSLGRADWGSGIVTQFGGAPRAP